MYLDCQFPPISGLIKQLFMAAEKAHILTFKQSQDELKDAVK